MVGLNRKGQGLVEYILAVALIALLVVGAIRHFSGKTAKAFKDAGDMLESQTKHVHG